MAFKKVSQEGKNIIWRVFLKIYLTFTFLLLPDLSKGYFMNYRKGQTLKLIYYFSFPWMNTFILKRSNDNTNKFYFQELVNYTSVNLIIEQIILSLMQLQETMSVTFIGKISWCDFGIHICLLWKNIADYKPI